MKTFTPFEKTFIIPLIVEALNEVTHKQVALSAGAMVDRFKGRILAKDSTYKFSDVRVREIVNYIRHNKMTKHPLLAHSTGYYICNRFTEIQEYLKSFRGRAIEIMNVAQSIDEWANESVQKEQLNLFD